MPFTALASLAVVFMVGRRQPMAIMDPVWPLTMLYGGPRGLIIHEWYGRAPAADAGHHGHHHHGHAAGPMWQATFKGVTHCSVGCALGDFIGDWIVVGSGFEIFGLSLGGRYLVGFVLAYLFGIAFQYPSAALMQGLGSRDSLVAAVKIDRLSLLAYQIGIVPHGGILGTVPCALADAVKLLVHDAGRDGGRLRPHLRVSWWLIATGLENMERLERERIARARGHDGCILGREHSGIGAAVLGESKGTASRQRAAGITIKKSCRPLRGGRKLLFT